VFAGAVVLALPFYLLSKWLLIIQVLPSFTAARLVVIGLLLVYVLICVGLAVSTRKGGAQYNKSITFGKQSDEERADGK
jgi:heme A synthase